MIKKCVAYIIIIINVVVEVGFVYNVENYGKTHNGALLYVWKTMLEKLCKLLIK